MTEQQLMIQGICFAAFATWIGFAIVFFSFYCDQTPLKSHKLEEVLAIWFWPLVLAMTIPMLVISYVWDLVQDALLRWSGHD